MHPDLARREVPLEKITRYLLDDLYPDGRSKAAFFRAFGFQRTRPHELREALNAHPDRNPVGNIEANPYGSNSSFDARFQLLTAATLASLRSGWSVTALPRAS